MEHMLELSISSYTTSTSLREMYYVCAKPMVRLVRDTIRVFLLTVNLRITYNAATSPTRREETVPEFKTNPFKRMHALLSSLYLSCPQASEAASSRMLKLMQSLVSQKTALESSIKFSVRNVQLQDSNKHFYYSFNHCCTFLWVLYA